MALKLPRLTLFAAVGLVVSVAGATAVSDPIMVTSEAGRSLLWNTVTHETETLQIEWPEPAVSCRIAVSNGEVVELADKTQTSVQVQFGRPEDAASERVLDLTLTFFDAEGTELAGETRSAQLGWVRGCGTDTFDLRPSDVARRPWERTNPRAVLFLGGDAQSFSTNGVQVSLGDLMQKWWYEMPTPVGEVTRACLVSADGTQFDRVLYAIVMGTLFIFR